MPIDPSIALQYQGPDFSNAIDTYWRSKNALLTNQKAQLEIEQAQKDAKQQADLEAFLSSPDLDLNDPKTRLGLSRFGKKGLEYGKAFDEQRKAHIDRIKTIRDMMKEGAAFGSQHPHLYREILTRFGQDTGEDMTDEIAELEALPDDAARSRWFLTQGLEADKLLPDTDVVNAGDRQVFTNTDPLTGQVSQTGALRVGLSPSEAARIAREDDPSLVASSTTDNAGNVTHFNKRGEVISTTPGAGKPTAQFEKNRNLKIQMNSDLNRAIKELEEVTKDGGLIDQSTGSGAGALVDAAAGFVGQATPGAIAIGKLQPIADIALKMVPRFEGPQSEKDTQSYKEAAGQLANPKMPTKIRKEAGKTVLRLMRERKGQFTVEGMEPEAPAAPATGGIKFLGFE